MQIQLQAGGYSHIQGEKEKKIEKKILKISIICLYLLVSACIRLYPPVSTCIRLQAPACSWICMDLHRFAQICSDLLRFAQVCSSVAPGKFRQICRRKKFIIISSFLWKWFDSIPLLRVKRILEECKEHNSYKVYIIIDLQG